MTRICVCLDDCMLTAVSVVCVCEHIYHPNVNTYSQEHKYVDKAKCFVCVQIYHPNVSTFSQEHYYMAGKTPPDRPRTVYNPEPKRVYTPES